MIKPREFNNLTLDFYGEDVSKETGVDNSYRYVLTLDLVRLNPGPFACRLRVVAVFSI